MSLVSCAGFGPTDLRWVGGFSDMDFAEQEDKMCARLEACSGNPDATAVLNKKLCELWRMRDGVRVFQTMRTVAEQSGFSSVECLAELSCLFAASDEGTKEFAWRGLLAVLDRVAEETGLLSCQMQELEAAKIARTEAQGEYEVALKERADAEARSVDVRARLRATAVEREARFVHKSGMACRPEHLLGAADSSCSVA
ncbi:MAG: hypothetical protein LBF24_04040 [Puniceicoccales bacterium]|jgi:hypothetical protein|nr:hypothetical protein [Puniceicoccales bacterium]